MQEDKSLHYPYKKMETQYMSRRIYSQKFKDNIRLHKFNGSDYSSKGEFETPDKIQNMQWKWKKFGKDSQWDLWKHILPPVVSNTFYYQKIKDSKDSLQSPQISLNRDYYHSQKHMSEKFQQFLYLEKIKNEEGYKSKLGDVGWSTFQFNGRIEGSGIRQKQLFSDDQEQNGYREDFNETSKPIYSMQMNKNGITTVNGSQSIKNTDAFMEVLKRHNNWGENRGHSIGFNQSTGDGSYFNLIFEDIL